MADDEDKTVLGQLHKVAGAGDAMEDDEDKTVLGQLRAIAVTEGFEKGSERFAKRMGQLQVVKCREMRGHHSCTECKVYDYCELVKQVMRDHRGY